jgi:hypothetical protein
MCNVRWVPQPHGERLGLVFFAFGILPGDTPQSKGKTTHSGQAGAPSVLLCLGSHDQSLGRQYTRHTRRKNAQSASHNISIAYRTELVSVAGATKSDREQMENDHWKKFASSADYSTQQRSLAGAPSFTAFRGPRLDEEPLKWLTDHKVALYIFGILADRENGSIKPVMSVCFYREGKSNAVHFCHSHNGPI